MRKMIFCLVSICVFFLLVISTAQSKEQIPEGWKKYVTNGNDSVYEIRVDDTVFRSKPKSYSIKSLESLTLKSSCELYQTIYTINYAGKRIKISLFAKGDIKQSLMYSCVYSDERMIKGVNQFIKSSEDWKNYSVVVDVAENATSLRYGVTLSGQGQIWFDDLNIEVVGKDVPEKNVYFPKLDKPHNLP